MTQKMIRDEQRCGDCVAESAAALADAAWIVGAGGEPFSAAVIFDENLAAVWREVAELHGDGQVGDHA